MRAIARGEPARRTGRRFVAGHRLAFMSLQLVHLAWFASTLDAGFDSTALMGSAAASAVLYTGFLLAEYRWNGYRVTPVLFYVTAGVFRLGAGVAYVAIAAEADRWELIAVGVYDVSGFLMQGHWLALLGDWCFLAGYVGLTSLYSRESHVPASVSPVLWRQIWRAGLVTAITAFALRLAERYMGFGGFDSLTGYVQSYGVAAGVYLMLLASRRSGDGRLAPQAGAAYALLAMDLTDGFFSYMKAPLLVAVLPLVLTGLDLTGLGSGAERRTRLVRPVAVSLVVAYFFLFVVSVYSPSRRAAFREYGFPDEMTDPYAVPVAPHLADAVLGALPGTAEFREAHRFPDGAWGLIGRMSMTQFSGWAYQRVESAGLRRDSFLEQLVTNVTPRIIWPDKPVLSPGHDFAVTIGQARAADSANSAVALTMQGSYYWWAGYTGLILGCAVTGVGFAAAWLVFRNQLMLNPVSAIVGLMLCHEGFRWFESEFLGGFPWYLYLLIVFVPMQFLVRHIVGYRAVTRAPTRRIPAWAR